MLLTYDNSLEVMSVMNYHHFMTSSSLRQFARSRASSSQPIGGSGTRVAPAGGKPKRKRRSTTAKAASEVKASADKAGLRGRMKGMQGQITRRYVKAYSLREVKAIVQRTVSELLDTALRDFPSAAPLVAARARGIEYKRSELENPENLSLADAAPRIGRSERFLNEKRREGQYYALVQDGSSRGYRYPDWQFAVDIGRLRTVLDRLNGYGASCWSIHTFLNTPHTQLGGRRPREVIAEELAALDPLLALAKARFDADQGAG